MHQIQFLKQMRPLVILALFAATISVSANTTLQLPATSEKKALETPWFPSRMHAFVWRNWTVVPCKRIAEILQAKPEQIEQVALSMGLKPQTSIDSTWLSSKGYITVLRRNWHLLPYEQILKLLNITSSQLAWRLIDDDYLYIKLGSIKPFCKPLLYHEPTSEENRKAAQISQWLKELKPYNKKETPRFQFFTNLSENHSAKETLSSETTRKDDRLNIAFSYCSEFGDPLLDSCLTSWPDILLKQLSSQGINGLWIHTSLSSFLPVDSLFPGSDSYKQRLNNLQKLVNRTKRYGIKIYLYVNEPRGTQQSYFQTSPSRQSLGGVKENDLQAFCTSDKRTLDRLRDGYRYVFSQVKDLGGVFTITASENLTSCASHGKQAECPRCSKREAADIISEVNNTIIEGVKEGNPNAETIVWDWGWNTKLAERIIPKLDKRCRFMSVSEWALPIERGGVKTTVGEYSISAVGPGPRALHHWEIARQCGLRVMAKIQVNTSWELGSITSIPAMQLIATHARRLAGQKMSGIMYCWSLGGYPSLNMKIFDQTLADTTLTLQQLAARHYNAKIADKIISAWEQFSKGMSQFPYQIQTLYYGPQHSAPANPFYLHNTGWNATMVGIPYDHLPAWKGPYPAETYVNLMRQTAKGFEDGIPFLKQALGKASKQKKELKHDIQQAKAIQLIYNCVANQAEFIYNRNLREQDAANKDHHLEIMKKCIENEKENVKQFLPILEEDPTIGYESSNQYFYIPQDVREKYINLRYTEQQLEKE